MNFDTKFKQDVFSILQFNPRYERIEKSMNENDELVFRFLIEDIIDELELALRPKIIIDEGDMLVWNAQVNYWFEVNRIYATFMDELVKEDKIRIDSQITKETEKLNAS